MHFIGLRLLCQPRPSNLSCPRNLSLPAAFSYGRRPLSSQPAPAGAPLWMKITGRPHDANSSELFSWQRFAAWPTDRGCARG